jgi:hypothetical protein
MPSSSRRIARSWLVAVVGFIGLACSSDRTNPPDAAPDAVPDAIIDATDACGVCTGDQLCIQRFDGTCRESVECVAPNPDCPSNACSAECEAAYCPAPYQCDNRPPCGGESPRAFTCYGP